MNLILSAYMGIFLTPVAIAALPGGASTPYDHVLTLVSISAATLLIGLGICSAVLRGRLRSEFSPTWDLFGGGLLGFLAGFLTGSFLAFLLCLTPYAQTESGRRLGLDAASQQATIGYLSGWCGLLNSIVSSSDAPSTRDVVRALVERATAPPEAAPTGETGVETGMEAVPADTAPAPDTGGATPSADPDDPTGPAVPSAAERAP
ncbi:MAG: hypothetical protein HUU20_03060 [Pirellulales bacterium]|nr:hypothetical protein [Pirellulales bacterium]